MDEFPAVVKHAGLPRRPTEVRRADTGMTWRVVEVRAAEKDVEHHGRAAETVYRLLVFGAMPYRPERDGQFEMITVNYLNRPYWWVRPILSRGPSARS
ncbi:hypothetical protein [Actinomadura violacea]|uniref:Uncharacterized protein n=1 Tax=Actinomadura violacea TaxID=2819934 RepID=A0ABS3S7N3_9ACTN|nr:hypothetical protein [Actinomadura violacea]MBO2465012.1 hypothetical protein [Actinomadura violacea]